MTILLPAGMAVMPANGPHPRRGYLHGPTLEFSDAGESALFLYNPSSEHRKFRVYWVEGGRQRADTVPNEKWALQVSDGVMCLTMIKGGPASFVCIGLKDD